MKFLLLCLFLLVTLKPIISAVPSSTSNSSSNIAPLLFPLNHKLQYEIRLSNTSTPGYKKFAKLIGTAYAFDALKQANEFALTTLTTRRFLPIYFYYPHILANQKGYKNVILSLSSFSKNNISYFSLVSSTKANEIRLNFDYMNVYNGDLRFEFTGILYHESARVWQWTGNGTAPAGLISGIADYVRLKAGFASEKWTTRGSGSNWDEGYAVTAYFLEYCSGLKNTFVRELNEKIKTNYSDIYFKDLANKSVADLWNDYKTLYRPLQYEVVANGSTRGDLRFKREVGDQYATLTLQRASEFALKTLNSNVRQDRTYRRVKLIIESFVGEKIPEMYHPSTARTTAGTIRLNSDYIKSFIGDLKADVTGILYHESTQVWQWTGNGTAPIGLVNGIADYVRLKAGWRSRNWPKRGSGKIWDEGYAVTAYFLEYCESLKHGFVSQLNTKMKYTYRPSYFSRILGKDVHQLWKDYKSTYAAKAPSPAASPNAAPPVPAEN